jgi:membrane-bound lytic murein transglycosylase A
MDHGKSRPGPNAWLLVGVTLSALGLSPWLGDREGLALLNIGSPGQSAPLLAMQGGASGYSLLPGWAHDDHVAAFANFHKVCAAMERRKAPAAASAIERALLAICGEALTRPSRVAPAEARQFFEFHFRPYRIKASGENLITGYFEPELDGSLTPSAAFPIPVYAKPPDLVRLGGEASSLGLPHFLTAARKTSFGYEPYYTRRQIEQGALNGRGLELLYLHQRLDAYVMQVQGSGFIKLREGGKVRLGFAAKNGYPYTSVARRRVGRREIAYERSPLEQVFGWLWGGPSPNQSPFWENQSYVFFRRLSEAQANLGPHGAFGTPLAAGRSLAIDPRYHRYGLPIWVYAPAFVDDHGKAFARLMVAEDTGAAIRGPVRGDVFWGTGAAAGAIAARTRHACAFYVLWPRGGALNRTASGTNY